MPRTAYRLYKRARSPFWQAAWTDAQGRNHRTSTGCRDRGEAATWLSTRERERVREQAGIPQARAVDLIHAAAEYLDERRPVWSKGWHQAVDGFLANRVIPYFGEGRLVASRT